MFLAKDFVETVGGLIFAVVENGEEQGKVLCFLRYIYQNEKWEKVNTEQANLFLKTHHPRFLYYSTLKQAHLHAVFPGDVSKHYQPKERLKILLVSKNTDSVENDLISLCILFKKQGLNLNEIGVTGSILIGAQNQKSDIDLVFYARDVFNQARKITENLIQQGDCSQLNEAQWKQSWERRSCDLSFREYVWHEKRKFNKAIINQRKFDLSLVSEVTQNRPAKQYKKLQSLVLKTQVTDDSYAYDYPAEFSINHKQIKAIVCYTATYTGQAVTGEWIEVSGVVEQSDDGVRRIVVGSNREASGEYIKVIDETP